MEWPPQRKRMFEAKKACCDCGPSCAIECVSKTFEGSPVFGPVSLSINSGTSPCYDAANRTLSVTVSATGNTYTSSGTAAKGTTASAAGSWANGGFVCEALTLGYWSDLDNTTPVSLTGSGAMEWSYTLAYGAVQAAVWGESPSTISVAAGFHTANSLTECFVTTSTAVGASEPATTGEECVAYFDASLTGKCGTPSDPDKVLADGTFSARFVRARLVLSRLQIGVQYDATIFISRRARGSSDPWVEVSSTIFNFTADSTEDVTAYINVGGPATEYEYLASRCSLAEVSSGGTYDECYTTAYNDSLAAASAANYATGYAAGLACDPNPAGTEPAPTAYSPGPGKTCEDGTADGETDGTAYGTWQGLQFGWEDGTEDASC